MSDSKLILPHRYTPLLGILETEQAIKLAKDTFERELAGALHLTRVSAPLFVFPESGLNDNLSGVERPVRFDVGALGRQVEVVHSLAKWKRLALHRYGFAPGQGLYTDMNAIRRDEELDHLHSIYVDQWDWERVITREERRMETLHDAARRILEALWKTQQALRLRFPQLPGVLPRELAILTTQELEDRYPHLTPKEREDAVCRERGAVLLTQIGLSLAGGKPHDSRAPDYDDWQLNGDLLVWHPVLERGVELSSMGVRVDRQALERQLALAGCQQRRELPFHRMLLEDRLPLTVGGGIGQSRICMILLQKAHIGEVQAAVWPQEMIDACEARGITLL